VARWKTKILSPVLEKKWMRMDKKEGSQRRMVKKRKAVRGK